MRDLEDRIVALLAAAAEADEYLSRVMTAAGGVDPQSPADHGAAGADPAGMRAELQRATDQAVVDQMARIQAIQKQLDEALKTMVMGRPGSSEFDAANNTARKLKGELATALNDLGNIPDYSKVDPTSITVSPDGHFLINTTEGGVPYQVYGQLKNGSGEIFDQAKGTSYTFKDGTLVSTNTPDPGRVTPDDELLFNAVTTAVGAPEAALAAKGLGQAGIHGLKALLGREAFEGAAGITGDNVLPRALVAAEARADDAAANLAGNHPPPTLDRHALPPVDNPTPATPGREQPLPGPAGVHPTPTGSVGDHPMPVTGGADHNPSPIGAPTTYAPEAPSAAANLNSAFANGDSTTELAHQVAELSTHHVGNADRVVLGKWDGPDGGYIGEARHNGGIYYDTGGETWDAIGRGLDKPDANALGWQVNEQFLKTQLENGIPRIDYVVEGTRFSSIEDVVRTDPNSFSAKEIAYLMQNAPAYGYERIGNSWVRIGG
jgi:hypothetical protein